MNQYFQLITKKKLNLIVLMIIENWVNVKNNFVILMRLNMNWIKYGEFYDKFCKNSNKLELYKKLKNLQDWKKRNKSKKPDFNRISFKDWNEVDEVLNQVVQQVFGVENWSDFHSILSLTHDWYESLDEIFFPLNRVKEIPKYAENWE